MGMGSDDHYRLLIESMRDLAVYMIDTHGCVVSWNPGAEHLKGYTSSEIIGKPFSMFYTEEDRVEGLPDAALACALRDGTYETEGWRVRKDGSVFWASVILNPVRDASDQLIGYSKITRDLTKRRAALEAQRLSEEQFRRLVQGVVDYAIYMLDIQGHVATWNAGAQHIKGYRAEEIIGQHFSVFYSEEDRLAGEPQRSLSIALEKGRFENRAWRVRKDGTLFWAHVVIDRIDDEHGAPMGFAKITRDATESLRAEQDMEEMRKALHQAQKMEAIGQLTGGVAHDFNNLLQVIGGNLQLLEGEMDGNDRGQRRLINAMAGVERGAKLASQLLSFGRRQPLEPKVVSSGRLIGEMDDLLRRTLGEGVQIETMVGGGLWNSLIDPVNLENALLNLAINARDAMRGQGRLTIEAENALLDDHYVKQQPGLKAGQYVLISVSDTGCGMSADLLEKAFDPFFSTKPEGSGTGLGLSMVYGFVKQSGGHIKMYSEVGHGTTVKLYLPRAMEAELPVDVVRAGDVQGGTESILVVEDDDAVRDTAVSLLQKLGYKVFQARDAQSALTVLDSGIALDLMFTDVIMPGPIRSPELAQKAKARLPHLAVLFTSGYTENAIVHAGRLDSGVELLSKPYGSDALARKVRQVLETQQKRNATAAAHTPQSSAVVVNKKRVSDSASAGLHVLLCEDDDLIRSTVKDMLESKGYAVADASSATEALYLWTIHEADILITDIGLPDISGAELAQMIREKAPGLPIIFATGRFDDPPVALSGHSKTLIKPYGIEKLIEAIRTLTGHG